MKFRRFQRYHRRPVSNQRVAAAKRSIHTKREKYPILDRLGYFDDETPEGKIETAEGMVVAQFLKMRDIQAKHWRKGRVMLFGLSADQRKEAVVWWAGCSYPVNGTYFIEFMKKYVSGDWRKHLDQLEEIRRRAGQGDFPKVAFTKVAGQPLQVHRGDAPYQPGEIVTDISELDDSEG